MQNSGLTGLSILIVEDEPLLRKQATAFLERLGADVNSVDSLERARLLASSMGFDFALLDLNLPDGLSTELLREKIFPQTTGVIIMTAEGGADSAVEAMKLGAIDYLTKPFDLAELPLIISRARRSRQNERVEEHRRKDDPSSHFLFGSSLAHLQSQLQKILAADRRVQTALPPILIQGETGTGKTTIARWIHHQGPRAGFPLVEVNCSALPETLAESELFGHERGAFTDARTARLGLFEAADGGTLFLDELPSLSLPLQAKVLKAIEDQKIRRIGANKEISVNVRIIAATNRDLPGLIQTGEFREDLYHRLDLFRIALSPLRERGKDILELARFYLDQLSRKHRLPGKTLHPDGAANLLAYAWPGNIRELSHEIERAIVFEDGPELKFENLRRFPGDAQGSGKMAPDQWFNEAFVFPPEGFSLDSAILHLIQHALKQSQNNVSGAARLLGVSRDFLRYRLNDKSEGESKPSAE